MRPGIFFLKVLFKEIFKANVSFMKRLLVGELSGQEQHLQFPAGYLPDLIFSYRLIPSRKSGEIKTNLRPSSENPDLPIIT